MCLCAFHRVVCNCHYCLKDNKSFPCVSLFYYQDTPEIKKLFSVLGPNFAFEPAILADWAV